MEMLDAVTAFDGAVSGLSKLTSLIRNVRGDVKNSEISEAVDAVRDDLNSARERVTLLITENLSMQQKIATLTEENMKLNQAAERHKAFDVDAEKYELVSVGDHTTLYAPKASGNDGEPAHYLCVQCYGDRQKSILQMKHKDFGFDILACSRCKAEYRVQNNRTLQIETTSTNRDRWDGY